MKRRIFGFYQLLYIVLSFHLYLCDEEGICDRRPLGTTTDPLPPDNRFLLEIKDAHDDKYIPKRQYEVRLFSRDKKTPFIAFTISLREDFIKNKYNPRKPIMLKAGFLETHSSFNNAKYSHTCNNTIIQSDITPKTETKVLWTAPEKNNKCVTIFALVAVQPTVWYSFEGPLSKQVCEDRRKADDMQPTENDNCQVCEDARYQLTIEGMWSPNTHQFTYPVTQELARFSDIVGASHNKDFALYTYNSEAGDGLKMLAEQGNTTKMELEILDMVNDDIQISLVRTLIKATAPPRPNMSTVTNFRVTRRHHLVSLVMALLPSPDWFLGVSNMELCDATTNMWAENITFNLYPLDAGTDSGLTFESPNDETSPPQTITSADIAPNRAPKEDTRPYARLLFHLVRTYSNLDCSEEHPATEETGGGTSDDNGGEPGDGEDGSEEKNKFEYRPSPVPTTTTSEQPPSVDPDTEESKCPMTTWSDWAVCDGECINNKVNGYQARYRQHVGDPTPECIEEAATEDFQPCSEDCEEEEPAPDENEEQE
ncbi:unnamed protein product [Arctia plantaginis]|uniref:Spondin-1 n=1 Tax=Arctia plantaginis TaxID=874455 RepID=A0A8S0YTG4_ARCPL|nr:unnamed protein product [Arctia plantaginis]CAB3255710.1 unnamed protein product [Arctia plantaginis]